MVRVPGHSPSSLLLSSSSSNDDCVYNHYHNHNLPESWRRRRWFLSWLPSKECIWFWYILFGVIHEVSHLLTASLLLGKQQRQPIVRWLYDILIGRQCRLSVATSAVGSDISIIHDDEKNIKLFTGSSNVSLELASKIIRHTGWICSMIMVLLVAVSVRSSNNCTKAPSTAAVAALFSNGIFFAALITALEAVSTDLFGWEPTLPLHRNFVEQDSSFESDIRSASNAITLSFYCGNFGMILLNYWWFKERKSETVALDTLQQMIEVTMMRGAQSGGCITYYEQEDENKKGNNFNGETVIKSKAVRSRVVNRKRTDLSKLVRRKVERDVRETTKNIVDEKAFAPRMLVGHTRFATSSLSTLDGTHPHRWTPPSPRRVYALDVDINRYNNYTGSSASMKDRHQQPTVTVVENYITHNGDFDFYRSHGRLYELETVQNWLSIVTETKTPASVDSCAIAGMVDMIRTQSSFSLSARYALTLGMEETSCGMKNADGGKAFYFPPFHSYIETELGRAFERAFDMYRDQNNNSDNSLRSIGENKQARIDVARSAFKELKSLSKERIQPLMKLMNSFAQKQQPRLSTPEMVVSVPNRSDIANTAKNNKTQIVIIEEDDEYEHKDDYNASSKDGKSSNDYSLYSMSDAGMEKLTSSSSSVPQPRQQEHTENTNIDSTADDIESNSIFDEFLRTFCRTTIDAFFDNDLFMTTKTFMQNAKGSFGISVTSNLDSHRQMCLAARGQTVSIAFYPQIDLICYGSEQAAVKAGMNISTEEICGGENKAAVRNQSDKEIDNESTRLDLDDLGGEVIVLDWGRKRYRTSPVSSPNRNLEQFHLMNGKISAILHQESKSTKIDHDLWHRMTKLSENSLIRPLKKFTEDPVKTDIQDIPSVCKNIQDDWHSRRAASSLNRLTAFNLSRCLRRRLEQHVAGTVPPMSVDVLITGCEVSLWLGEQFASDLKKAFPNLTIEAVSSNKILGLYGQEIAVPSIGFPYAPQTRNIDDSIVIIISHSGGTFGPLACSNLLQSTTKDIFVVTSEWDTQIGKQLRMIDEMDDGASEYIMKQRIFSTEIGMRPAEPCSVSVVATHQLLTNLFEYISVLILSDKRFRTVTKAQITEQDLEILEKCNQMNINALTEIVGYNVFGYSLDRLSPLLVNLRELGDLWGDHILENARSYLMCFVYIVVTVTSGWPLFAAIGRAFGAADESVVYFLKFLDSLVYFWLPQICITIIRIIQGRNLRHRMVGRTIVIGDIPWVSQCADAFLSKCFAVSYSIAGLNVLSGNPTDHFVHRHTHRVVRGTLAVFGRADGRLSALSTAEASSCLSCNQASSIQSWGGTCESITIGHNPFKLDLSKTGIFLKRHRPLFLCERMLMETDAADEEEGRREKGEDKDDGSVMTNGHRDSIWTTCSNMLPCFKKKEVQKGLTMSIHSIMDCSISVKIHKQRSSHALVGAYMDIDQKGIINNKSASKDDFDPDEVQDSYLVDDIVSGAIRERKVNDRLHILFNAFDKRNRGILTEDDFVAGFTALDPSLSESEAKIMFKEADTDHSSEIDYNQFIVFLRNSGYYQQVKIPPSNRNKRGLIQVEASKDKYFGETLRKYNAGKNNVKDMDFVLAKSQHFVQELYESRIASMQRFVVMCVLFHHIAKRVETFFRTISFGMWSYRLDRTHSIVRIATTASPTSGSDVRNRIENLRLAKKVIVSVRTIESAYLTYRKKRNVKGVK